MNNTNTTHEVNVCSKLFSESALNDAKSVYKELQQSGQDPFEYMLNMQYDLQLALHKKASKHNPDPKQLKTIGEKFDFIREAKQALDDEYREMIDALPGMELPPKVRSAVWKRWKTQHDEIRARTFDDLSSDELIELKFEMCDFYHFVMNMMLALDMTAEEMFMYYYIKNAENPQRALNGY